MHIIKVPTYLGKENSVYALGHIPIGAFYHVDSRWYFRCDHRGNIDDFVWVRGLAFTHDGRYYTREQDQWYENVDNPVPTPPAAHYGDW